MNPEDILETGLGVGLGLTAVSFLFGKSKQGKAVDLVSEAYYSGKITQERAVELLKEIKNS